MTKCAALPPGVSPGIGKPRRPRNAAASAMFGAKEGGETSAQRGEAG